MYEKTVKVAAIHDLSGVGRCSLSVILPTLSVLGIQVCPVPTAILSAHTGGFGDIVKHDLSGYILPALEHYESLNYNFNCVYSGYLASVEQISHCLEFFSYYEYSLKVVDPVMADNGKPYKMFTPDFFTRMKELVAVADIVTPNITEAAVLLSENTSKNELTSQEIKSYLVRISELGPEIAVITSVVCGGMVYNAGYDKKHSKFWRVPVKYINVNYPGTGDIFTSVLTGSILKGDSLPIAMNRATAFLDRAIKMTYSYSTETREGIMLENCLDFLLTNTALFDYEQF